MPGIVLASRRWMIASDDFIIPASILLIAHLSWLSAYIYLAVAAHSYLVDVICPSQLMYHMFGQAVAMGACALLEACLIYVSCQGSILETESRRAIPALVGIRSIIFILEIAYEVYGLVLYFKDDNLDRPSRCHPSAKEKWLAFKIANFIILLIFTVIAWASYDPAGRSWVKAKTFHESLKDPKIKYKRSKNSARNWRQREAMREYERSWDNRCRAFCCFLTLKDGGRSSGKNFSEVAKLLSDFFRDLDVVPSDVVAGLSLMRVQQKALRVERVQKSVDGVFRFLSGVSITNESKFLDLTNDLVVGELQSMLHYFHYSLAIYGWPMYIMANSPTKWCRLLNYTRCCGNASSLGPLGFGCIGRPAVDADTIVEGSTLADEHLPLNTGRHIGPTVGDNCCLCNRAAIEETCLDHNYRIIYITYQVAVEKPPFFVAVDLDKMSIVISIRGTLSLYDVLTDLNAENEILPLNPPKESFFGHKGMVAAAAYIRSRLMELSLLERANRVLAKNDVVERPRYPIVIVGHSLGAGTAAILAILLRQTYRDVIGFAFAPPGGLLSEEAMEASKEFVVSIVLGKDIVPRLGLHQMEKLRFDLIRAMKRCHLNKWSVIVRSCFFGHRDFRSMEDFLEEYHMERPVESDMLTGDEEDEFKKLSIHPNDESISLTVHTPLYPPGSMIHLVKMYPDKDDLLYQSKWRQILNKHTEIIQALWTENKSFNEILISPTMIKDHMPDRMLQALQSLLSKFGPQKPTRAPPNRSPPAGNAQHSMPSTSTSSDASADASGAQKVLLETSFAHACTRQPSSSTNDDDDDGDENRELAGLSYLDKQKLERLKSLVRRGRAPLAMPETDDLNSILVSVEPTPPPPPPVVVQPS